MRFITQHDVLTSDGMQVQKNLRDDDPRIQNDDDAQQDLYWIAVECFHYLLTKSANKEICTTKLLLVKETLEVYSGRKLKFKLHDSFYSFGTI